MTTPPAIRRQLNSLLRHQGWLWGKDVRCATGNRLIASGFERLPAASDIVNGATRYRLEEANRLILLWSYGFTVYRPSWQEAVHVSRGADDIYGVSIAALDQPGWCYEQAKTHWSPLSDAMASQVPDVLCWVASYEETIQEQIGSQQRDAELQEWRLARRNASGLPEGWRALATDWTIHVPSTHHEIEARLQRSV